MLEASEQRVVASSARYSRSLAGDTGPDACTGGGGYDAMAYTERVPVARSITPLAWVLTSNR
jgi:hypothetical protein